MHLRNIYRRLKSYTLDNRPRAQIPNVTLPILTARQQIPPIPTPAQALHLSRMTLQLPCYAIGFHVEDHDSAVDAPRGEEVPFAVESHASCVSAAEGAGCGLRVVLREDKGVS